MKFTILGSGGAIRIPKACCTCDVCSEARSKGYPYKRLGQSLYMNDEMILFDTPEDINEELNNHNIVDVNHIFYSHWHPDHTLGCRVIETIMDERENTKLPINVSMPKMGIDIRIEDNSLFRYYESIGFCKVNNSDEEEVFGSVRIKKVLVTNGFSYGFLIKEGDKKVFYCPCHSKCIPVSDNLYNLDLLILSKGYSSILNDEYTNFKRDTLRIISELKPKKTIITHIEETDGFSYDDYVEQEKELEDIMFAYDGLIIDI